NFGLALAPIPKLVCYRVDPTGRLTTLGAVRLSAPMFNHDVGLTKRHMVFVVPPLVFRPSKLAGAALGLHDYIDALEYDAERPTMIALVPRDGGRVRIVHTEPLMHLHIANAYDDGADTVVELLNYDASWTQLNAQLLTVDGTVPDTTMPYGGVLRRIRITRSGRLMHEPLTDLRGDLPPSAGATSRWSTHASAAAATATPIWWSERRAARIRARWPNWTATPGHRRCTGYRRAASPPNRSSSRARAVPPRTTAGWRWWYRTVTGTERICGCWTPARCPPIRCSPVTSATPCR